MANQEHITIRHAVDRYINAKSAVLSPSTVAGYIRYRNLYLRSIYDKYIDEITQEEFQIAVNKETKCTIIKDNLDYSKFFNVMNVSISAVYVMLSYLIEGGLGTS